MCLCRECHHLTLALLAQNCSFLERFAIFSREQQQVQTDAQGSDLLSYVQMQRNLRWVAKLCSIKPRAQRNINARHHAMCTLCAAAHRLATKVYREALFAMADFWQMLIRHEVRTNS